MIKKIYYHDTDAGGVVYYGTYLNYLEESRTEFLVSHGLSPETLKNKEFFYAVRQCNVSYLAPARYGDIILCEANLKKITAVQMLFEQTIHHKETGKLLVEAVVTLVSLSKNFKPIPISEDLRLKLSALC